MTVERPVGLFLEYLDKLTPRLGTEGGSDPNEPDLDLFAFESLLNSFGNSLGNSFGNSFSTAALFTS